MKSKSQKKKRIKDAETPKSNVSGGLTPGASKFSRYSREVMWREDHSQKLSLAEKLKPKINEDSAELKLSSL